MHNSISSTKSLTSKTHSTNKYKAFLLIVGCEQNVDNQKAINKPFNLPQEDVALPSDSSEAVLRSCRVDDVLSNVEMTKLNQWNVQPDNEIVQLDYSGGTDQVRAMNRHPRSSRNQRKTLLDAQEHRAAVKDTSRDTSREESPIDTNDDIEIIQRLQAKCDEVRQQSVNLNQVMGSRYKTKAKLARTFFSWQKRKQEKFLKSIRERICIGVVGNIPVPIEGKAENLKYKFGQFRQAHSDETIVFTLHIEDVSSIIDGKMFLKVERGFFVL
ncbi:hypothetical protein DFH28DRAFT_924571 [Melampsora americana]|nr:hypothetical protein DFH28DRAFT_924571 [Melampsora americana]